MWYRKLTKPHLHFDFKKFSLYLHLMSIIFRFIGFGSAKHGGEKPNRPRSGAGPTLIVQGQLRSSAEVAAVHDLPQHVQWQGETEVVPYQTLSQRVGQSHEQIRT
jgi:hypothetical protein